MVLQKLALNQPEFRPWHAKEKTYLVKYSLFRPYLLKSFSGRYCFCSILCQLNSKSLWSLSVYWQFYRIFGYLIRIIWEMTDKNHVFGLNEQEITLKRTNQPEKKTLSPSESSRCLDTRLGGLQQTRLDLIHTKKLNEFSREKWLF